MESKKNFCLILGSILLSIQSFAALPELTPQADKSRTLFWAGASLGTYQLFHGKSEGMIGLSMNLCLKLNNRLITLRRHKGSNFMGDINEISEYDAMYGYCGKVDNLFISASLGIGYMQGYIDIATSGLQRIFGVPLEVQWIIRLSPYLGLSMNLNSFLWKYPYWNCSFGMLFGKLR